MRYSLTALRTRTGFGILVLLLSALAGCEGGGTGPDDKRIGPDGGVASLEGGAVTLAVPAGALSGEIWFTAMPTVAVPVSELLLSGSTYEVGPPGTSFNASATLTLSYDPSRLPSGMGEDGLGIYQVAGSEWMLMPSPSVNVATRTVSGQVRTLGRFGVLAIPVFSVDVEPGSSTLERGASVQLAAVPKASNGMPLDSRPVVWTTADPTVATVSSTGLVTGVAEGTTTITASSGDHEGVAEVSVTVPVAAVAVAPASGTVKAGETLQMTATTADARGNELEGRIVTWTSSDPGVATVNGKGLVSGVGVGTAAITAEAEGKAGTATVAVHGPLSVETASLSRGVIGTPYYQALAATGGDGTYSWIVSGGNLPAGLALTSSTGVLSGTPTAPGTSDFTVRVESAGQTSFKSLSIAVDLIPVALVEILPSAAALTLGDTLRFSATAVDTAGNVLTGRPKTWESSAPDVATVSVTGLVSALAVGSTTIRATVDGFPGWALVTVNGVLGISDTDLATGVVGVLYSDSLHAVGGDGTYRWTIAGGALPPGLSLTETTGVLGGTPTGHGTTTFTVEATSGDAQTAVKALSIVVHTPLVVSTNSLSGGIVGTPYNQALSATGGAGPYLWSVVGGSLPGGMGLNTISGAITGTPAAEGTSDFTVEVTSADGQTATKSLSIAVNPVPVASVEVTPASGSLTPGQTLQLTATPRDASANDLTGRTVSWISSDGGVATVDPSGLVTSTGVGFAMITASVEGRSDTATITVYSVLNVLTSALAGGVVGAGYNQALAATGGNGSYTWSVSVGTLPDGLALDAGTGVISGTPTAGGTWALTVEVTSGDGQTAAQALSIVVV